MSSAILQGGASGTGSMTVLAPNTNSNQIVTIPDATGTVMVSGNMPAFSAYPSTNQAVTSAWTKVVLDSEEFDTNNNFASSRFTPTIAGYYSIIGVTSLTGTTARTQTAIYKNGSVFKYGSDIVYASSLGSSATALIYMNGSTDYLELYIWNGNSTSVASGATLTYFQGEMVRSA